jgi:hypothetical protein
MAQLTIPEEYVSGLAQIVSLPNEVIDELASALAESPTSLDVQAATSLISAKVPAVPNKDLRRILAALLSLYSVRAFSEAAAEDFLDEVARAMKRTRRPADHGIEGHVLATRT